MLLTAVIEVDGTRMSRDNIHDQFVCRIWHTRVPLWALLVTSTYGFLLIAFERYIAVIYPLWYNVSMKLLKQRRRTSRSLTLKVRSHYARPRGAVVTERMHFNGVVHIPRVDASCRSVNDAEIELGSISASF